MTIQGSTSELGATGLAFDSTIIKNNLGYIDKAASLPLSKDWIERRRRAGLFCQTAKRLLTNLPGIAPGVALFLDDDYIILDSVFGQSDAEGLLLNEMKEFRNGSLFSAAAALDKIPLYSESNPKVLRNMGTMDSDKWHGVITSVTSSTTNMDIKHIAFLTKKRTAVRALGHSIVVCAHAIQQTLWEAERSDIARNNPKPAHGSQVNEEKLLDYEKNSSLAALCAGIAHEIRNPLTAARGFLQLFERHCREDDLPFLELTIQELDRVGQLVEDFMHIARPSQERTKETDLCELTYSVFQFLSPEANLCDVELSCHMPNQAVLLNVQEGRIKQVLINLLQNAVHACDAHGKVNICIEDSEFWVHLTISDNGSGIADIEKLFRPFHTTKENGNGLGMFVSKHIIEQHHGSIQVDSVVGQGTTLVIRLPRLA